MNLFNLDGGINTFYIISQIFALGGLIFDLIAIQRKRKTTLLNMDTMAAFCSFLHYAFLGAWAGMISKLVTTVRNAIAASETARKHKNSKILPIIFIVIYIVIGFFTFDSAFSVLPILAPCIYTVAIYTSDITKIRYVSVLTRVLWLIYDISVFSAAGIVAQIILMINGIIAIYRYAKKSKEQKN